MLPVLRETVAYEDTTSELADVLSTRTVDVKCRVKIRYTTILRSGEEYRQGAASPTGISLFRSKSSSWLHRTRVLCFRRWSRSSLKTGNGSGLYVTTVLLNPQRAAGFIT